MQRRTFLLGAGASAAVVTGGAVAWALRPQSGAGAGTPGTAPGSTLRVNRGRTSDTRTYGNTTLTRGEAADGAPNVLFISLDDCNDWLGYLNNHPGTSTPNV